MAVSEGIETGLSFMQATEIPTWAALSAGGLQALLLPPEVREVLIAADRDLVGLNAAQIAAARWHHAPQQAPKASQRLLTARYRPRWAGMVQSLVNADPCAARPWSFMMG